DPVQLEDLLCYIQTDSCNRHAWTLRSSLRWRDCHRWLTMKPLNTGWVHPINESVRTVGPVRVFEGYGSLSQPARQITGTRWNGPALGLAGGTNAHTEMCNDR